MFRTFMIGAVSAAALILSAESFAQQTGTADEAKAMLTKAVAAVKADQTKAIDMFTKGEGGFLVGDLYPFCFQMSDGKILTTQIKQYIGTDVRNLKDATGKLWCRRDLCWNLIGSLRSDEDTWSGSKVNRLIGEFLGQALPSVHFAHGDLT